MLHFSTLAFCIGFPLFPMAQESTIKVMTWNIRLDTPDDGVNRWDNRKAGVAAEILAQDIDVLGVQEALSNQVKDLNKRLKGYKGLGVGRDDGKKRGEYNSVYFKRKKFKVIRWGAFWLSESPDQPGSRGWDAACNRLATWVELKNKKNSEHFMVFNTHFDHMGDTARVESAALISRKIAELSGNLPVVLMGDFNVDSKSRPYRILTFPENERVLFDTQQRAEEITGPGITWVSFDPDYQDTRIIDFIFATDEFQVLKHSVTDFRSGDKFLSDHLPVTAILKLK